MKVFVIGGTGRVGASLVRQLLDFDHEVIVGSRHENEELTAAGATFKELDLHASYDEIAEIIGDVDAIYFTAGSRGKDLLQSDAFGAVKTMQAAKRNGVKRYIMLSAYKSLEPTAFDVEPYSQIKEYYMAKYFADYHLVHMPELDYTIMQPVALVEEKGSHMYATGSDIEKTVAIEDVALALVHVLENPATFHKIIPFSNGKADFGSVITACQ